MHSLAAKETCVWITSSLKLCKNISARQAVLVKHVEHTSSLYVELEGAKAAFEYCRTAVRWCPKREPRVCTDCSNFRCRKHFV